MATYSSLKKCMTKVWGWNQRMHCFLATFSSRRHSTVARFLWAIKRKAYHTATYYCNRKKNPEKSKPSCFESLIVKMGHNLFAIIYRLTFSHIVKLALGYLFSNNGITVTCFILYKLCRCTLWIYLVLSPICSHFVIVQLYFCKHQQERRKGNISCLGQS